MLRHRKKTLQTVKSFDAFPKTSTECVETSTTGGTFSVLGFALMIWLVTWECMYYLETNFKFKFTPDIDFREKLNINVDITVAMPCKYVGADVLDLTGQQVMSFGELDMDDTWWELDPNQQIHFESMQRVNSYLREQFHSVHHLLWRNGYTNIFSSIPERIGTPNYDKDACRIHGKMNINKVAGNFHVTAGKTIPLPRGHAHLAIFMDDNDFNFTHRIEKFSFGDPAPGIIHPLEGDEQTTHSHFMTYQYFITIVPTKVNTYSHRGNTFQYSVAEQGREISHDKGSHGTPGIFFKYDVSALTVEVLEEHESFIKFITRLCGIIGGVFTVSGLLSRFMGFFVNCFCCRFFRQGQSESLDEDEISVTVGLFSATIIPHDSNSPVPTTPTPQSITKSIPPGPPAKINTAPTNTLADSDGDFSDVKPILQSGTKDS